MLAEVVSLKEVKISDMIKFIKHHVLYHFGVPRQIIHDNGPQFISQTFQRFRNKFRFKVYLQRHTIQLQTVLQKPLTRLLESFLKSLSQKVNESGMTN